MKKFIEWMESPETLLRGTLMILSIYTVHNSYILHSLEVIDLAFKTSIFGEEYNVYIFNAVMSLVFAAFTEFIVLLLFIHGKLWFGRLYAIGTFGLNIFYYTYYPDKINPALVIVAVFISFIHLVSIWYLAELFYEYRQRIKKFLGMQDKPVRSRPEKESSSKNIISENKHVADVPVPSIGHEPDKRKLIIDSIALECLQPDESYVCKFCQEDFVNKYSFSRHLERKHKEIFEHQESEQQIFQSA